MKTKILLPFAIAGVMGLGVVGAFADDDKPGTNKAGLDMPDKNMPDMDKMTMPEMKAACKSHSMMCEKHLDEAIKSADAGNLEETKKHLALAKVEMTKCMNMMAAMDKKQPQEGKTPTP